MTNILASENEFPIIRILEDPTPPTTPPTGVYYVYVDEATKTLHGRDDTGTVIDYDPTGAAIDWGETGDIADLAYDDVADAGVLNEAARADHVHGMPSAGGGGGDSILALIRYKAGSDTATFTTSSGTQADVDATNAAVTFTVPASGKVIIDVAFCGANNGSANSFVGLREGGSNLIGPYLHTSSDKITRGVTSFYITGLTPAASKTYKLAWSTSGSTFTAYTGPTYGTLDMTVHAAP
jgi:hypothetical protein